MKKKFLMLCMILTALLFLCTLTACDETDPNVEVPEHEHTLGEWQEVLAPTCSTQGVRAKLCTVEGCQQFELELDRQTRAYIYLHHCSVHLCRAGLHDVYLLGLRR